MLNVGVSIDDSEQCEFGMRFLDHFRGIKYNDMQVYYIRAIPANDSEFVLCFYRSYLSRSKYCCTYTYLSAFCTLLNGFIIIILILQFNYTQVFFYFMNPTLPPFIVFFEFQKKWKPELILNWTIAYILNIIR